MRKSTFLVAGIAIGVLVAKQIESNPEAKKAFDSATAKAKEFANAVAAGYKEQESKTNAPVKKTRTASPKNVPSTSKRAR
jgi:hypothetical protein